ncbi:MAG: hypothetical protein EBU88_00955, partial [Acidobacteria bacterium]|nr:hypothetical protein [Acidobacteriota bacterium]
MTNKTIGVQPGPQRVGLTRGLVFGLMLIIWSVVFQGQLLGQDLVGLYLTWKGDPTTTMTVNWVDLFEGSSRTLWYRRQGAAEWVTAEGTHTRAGVSTLQVRRVELTGLLPDTSYEFGIGKQPGREADLWRFRTMPADLS